MTNRSSQSPEEPKSKYLSLLSSTGDRDKSLTKSTRNDELEQGTKKPLAPAPMRTIPKTESYRTNIEQMKLKYVIYPWSQPYRIWWANSVFWSILTIFFETYQIAFDSAGLYPYDDATLTFQYIFYAIFLVDIVINFNLAYFNERDELVVDRHVIAREYLSRMFWVDLLGVVPFYTIVLACTGLYGVNNQLTQCLALLRLFRMVRLHRIVQVYDVLKYSSRVSLMTLTLVRNFGAALVWTHFAACAMYFIARQYGFDMHQTWIGGMLEDFDDHLDIKERVFERYLTSMYWSIVTFTTVGYGDFSPVNPAEQIWGMVYMLLNIILVSWMIGSMTLLIVKNDERTGKFRDMMQTLDQYSSIHRFDRKFKKQLKRQIEIDFKHRDTSDEMVLKYFPSSTRRKVLRRLYLPALKDCRLMRGVRQQFMDAFFRVCKVEVISSGEDIVQRGNIAADLYFLLEGTAKLMVWDEVCNTFSDGQSRAFAGDNESKAHPSGCFRKRELDQGEFINEISFFTETPQSHTIRTATICKTLTLPRFAYKSINKDNPGSLATILNNLLSKVEELAEDVGVSPQINFHTQLDELTARSESDPTSGSCTEQRTVEEVQAEVAFAAARDVISMHINKQEEDHTTTFLYAASRDDTTTLSLMLDQSFDPNSSDYNKRTALIVAAEKGNTESITLLLEFQANPNLKDVHGTSALLEATKRGHEAAMVALLNKGASLCLGEMESASTLCQAVFDGDMKFLERLLKAKIHVNSGDYDKRTAGHVAAADGNLHALKILLNYGLDLTSQDRWGNTIGDEAAQVGYKHILQYIEYFRSN